MNNSEPIVRFEGIPDTYNRHKPLADFRTVLGTDPIGRWARLLSGAVGCVPNVRNTYYLHSEGVCMSTSMHDPCKSLRGSVVEGSLVALVEKGMVSKDPRRRPGLHHLSPF